DVRKWVLSYQQHGIKGLMRKETKAKYTTDFKIKVVQIVINEGLSLNEAALRFEIGNKGIAISNWLKLYREHGID
ncbi:transposase, partial [Acinetobacter soli]